MKSILCAAAAIAAIVPAIAYADPVVDGVNGPGEYGAAKSTVAYNPSAPNSNFQTPTNETDHSGYSIFLEAVNGMVYGYLQAYGDAPIVGTFANLYWDIDPANNNGSDIGFELAPTHTNFFIPGLGSAASVTGITTAASGDGLGFEFAIPNSFFTSFVPGFTYYANQDLPGVGDSITLRLSQSFGYSVAGGASYGSDRLGSVTLDAAAVPEPASWAMMIGGFGLMGAAMRRRYRAQAATAIA